MEQSETLAMVEQRSKSCWVGCLQVWALPALGLGVFLLLTWVVAAGDGQTAWDWELAQFWRDHAQEHPGIRGFLAIITHVGDVASMTALAVLGTFWQLGRRRWLLALFWALTPLGGALLNVGVKAVIQRDRPPLEWRDRSINETNESFPSGHSMGIVIGLGVFGYVTMRDKSRPWKIAGFAFLGLVIFLVGFSRMYLRAHWASDVLGGFALGLAWLTVCVWGLGKAERELITKGEKG